jgi:glycine/D-amino acid oxidase-like deaminating enzyme
MRLAVVGGGIIGLAAAWNAARRGHAVALFERGPLPNTEGTSWDQHRLCRVPYGDQDGYARMMAEAYAAWDRAFAAMGERPYAETGCLALCTEAGDWTDRSRASLARLGLPFRVLTPAEVAARCPMLRVEDARYGLWTEPGGALFADAIVAGYVRLCGEAGVTMHAHADVGAVEDGVVTVSGRRFAFDAVLVAAGVRTPSLLPWLGEGVVALRQAVAYVAPPASLAEAWARAPVLLDMGGPRGMFCAPPVAGRGLKLGCGALNRPGDPGDGVTPREGEGARVMAAWSGRLADFDGYALVETRICYYANAADQVFRVGRRGAVLGITACSGHAFKFGALLGEALATMIEGGQAPWLRPRLTHPA